MLSWYTQACVESGFFYLINHGVEDELIKRVFDESKKFFSLPVEEKMKLERKGLTGYTPMYSETLDPTLKTGGLFLLETSEKLSSKIVQSK